MQGEHPRAGGHSGVRGHWGHPGAGTAPPARPTPARGPGAGRRAEAELEADHGWLYRGRPAAPPGRHRPRPAAGFGPGRHKAREGRRRDPLPGTGGEHTQRSARTGEIPGAAAARRTPRQRRGSDRAAWQVTRGKGTREGPLAALGIPQAAPARGRLLGSLCPSPAPSPSPGAAQSARRLRGAQERTDRDPKGSSEPEPCGGGQNCPQGCRRLRHGQSPAGHTGVWESAELMHSYRANAEKSRGQSLIALEQLVKWHWFSPEVQLSSVSRLRKAGAGWGQDNCHPQAPPSTWSPGMKIPRQEKKKAFPLI